jgi:hypothetical protein
MVKVPATTFQPDFFISSRLRLGRPFGIFASGFQIRILLAFVITEPYIIS